MQSRHYEPVNDASSVVRTESSANSDNCSFTLLTPDVDARTVSPRAGPQRNAPSRWRLRPASRLTAAEATADRRAINLGRSVLGASGTLGALDSAVKATRRGTFRILRTFLLAQHEIAIRRMCSSFSRRHKTAEPGIRPGLGRKIRRAGNAFVHLPDRLSASAYSCSEGFVLPAPRARRRDESMQGHLSDQEVTTRKFAQFAHVSIGGARTAPGAGRD